MTHNTESSARLRSEKSKLQQEVARLQAQVAQQQQRIQTLQARDTYHRVIIEQNSDALLVLQEGVVQFVNPAAEAMFRYVAEDLLGFYLGVVLETSHKMEVDILRKDGTRGVGEMRTTTINWKGNPAYLASFRDITDRKQTEEALRQANEALEQRTQELYETNSYLQRRQALFYTIFEGINDGLLLVDKANHILAANSAVDLLLGCSVEEVINKPLPGLFRPSKGERTPDLLFPNFWVSQTLRDGQPRRRRERIISPNGVAHTLDMQALPIYDTDKGGEKHVVQVVLHMVDVTEMLKMDALKLENERLNATRKLIEIVAHEVNTPLQTITSLLGMLHKTNAQERETYIQLSLDEIKRISMIMYQLRHIYHTKSDKHRPVDINNLIKQVLLLMHGRFAKHHIHVECQLTPTLPRLPCHADEITQVLLNLLYNAIEAMSNGGRIRIQTSIDPGTITNNPIGSDITDTFSYLRICIADSGMGIDQSTLPHIFEPFFASRKQGFGVGLFVCHKIITQHNGKLLVESQPKQGSTFTILLPFTQTYDEQPFLPSEPSEPSEKD